MKILYIGKHFTTASNDDEGAITSALISLGCEVKVVHERKAVWPNADDMDLVLFNHCSDFERLQSLKPPKIFWYFDRVIEREYGSPSRNATRSKWANNALSISELGFFTDGDWVANDKSGKAICLRQGCNQNLKAVIPSDDTFYPILFTGGGRDYGRATFVSALTEKYGKWFKHIPASCYQAKLAQTIADSRIVVAPDTPISDVYWSNRVYLTLGLGGFLIHPYCHELAQEFDDRIDLCFYKTRTEMFELIDHYLNENNKNDYELIRSYGQAKCITKYSYVQRCSELLDHIEERLKL